MIEFIDVPLGTVGSVDTISMELQFEAVCPVPGKPYGGTIDLKYRPMIFDKDDMMMARLLEWNSLQEYLKSIRGEKFMAEQLAHHILWKVSNITLSDDMSVTLFVESSFHLPVRVVART